MDAQRKTFLNKLLVGVLGLGLVLGSMCGPLFASAPGLPVEAAAQSTRADDSHLSAPEESDGPLQKAIERRYLDRWLLLRRDIQVVTARRIQWESEPPTLDEAAGGEPVANPVTVVTAQGVFYHSNSSELAYNPPLASVGGLHPVFDVHDRTVEPFANRNREKPPEPEILVALRSGEITRMVRITASPRGILARMDSARTRDGWVLFRLEVRSSSSKNEQLASFTGLLEQLFYLLPTDETQAPLEMDPTWPAGIKRAIRESEVVQGMTPRQVLLSFGAPIHVTRRVGDSREIWLFKRGQSIREQLRNTTNVVFSDGRVVVVEEATPWGRGSFVPPGSDS